MASSSSCFFVVTMTILSQFLFAPTSGLINMEFIDANCQKVNNKPFCIDTLTTYPPAVSASGLLPLADAVLNLAISHAEKTASFAVASKESHDAYISIVSSLKSAKLQLKASAETANYDVMVCGDQIKRVKDSIGQSTDKSSKTLLEMTLQMEKLLDLAVGATDTLDG